MCRISTLLKAVSVMAVIAVVMAGTANAATISGTVYVNDGATTNASPDTEVVAVDNSIYAVTDLSGNYTLTVPAGTYTLTVRRWEYLTQRMTLTVNADDNLTGTDFTLSKPASIGISACADFSVSIGNPNRMWSYGYQDGEGSFVPFTTLGIFNEIDRWWMGSDDNGAVHRNRLSLENWRPTWWASAGGMYWEPRMLTVAAGTLGMKSVIRWTAPSTGTYRVDVRYAGQEGYGVDANVYVLKNGTSLFSGQLNGFNGFLPDRYQRSGTYELTFLQEVTVNQGDNLDFAVDDAGTPNSDLVSASVDIIPLTPVSNGTITGIVTENATGNPAIPGARIRVLNTSDFAITGSDGSYTISEPPGTYTIEVRKRGFVPQRVTIALASSTVTQDFSLDQVAAGTDAATDFSASINPNGRWSYLHPVDNPDTYLWHGVFDPAYPALQGWCNVTTEAGGNPDVQRKGQITKNTGTEDIWVPWYEGQEYEAGQLIQQGDFFGQDTTVRYTVPEGGTYSLDAYFTAQDTNITYGKVFVRVNEVQVFYGDLSGFYGRPPDSLDRFGLYEQSYNNTLTLQRNDTVDFVVQSRNSQMPSDHGHPWATVGGNYLVTRVLGGTGTLAGTVTSSAPGNAPLAGATVKTTDGTASTLTDSNGNYALVLFEGTYTLSVSKPGFYMKNQDLNIIADTSATIDVSLDPWSATRWDVAAEFSATSNPTGTWRYGTGWPFELMPDPVTLGGNPSLPGWLANSSNPDCFGQVAKNISDARILSDQWHGLVVYEPHMFFANPGACPGTITVVRWTAPYETYVRTWAQFTGQKDRQAVDVTARVLKNGTEQFSGVVNGFVGYEPDYTGAFGTGKQTFETPAPIHVAQGETIDFTVSGNQDYSTGHYETVGLNALVFPVPCGTLAGTVTSSAPGNAPVAGATIKNSDGSVSVTTDSNGHYSVALLPGTYTLSVSKSEFFTTNEAVTIIAGTSATMDVSLDPWPTTRWDANAEFSSSSNPAGEWQYGTLTTPTSPFTLNDIPTILGAPTVPAWTCSSSQDCFGAVGKNVSDTRRVDVQWHGTVVIEPYMFLANPGACGGTTTVVRWTAPYETYVKAWAQFTGQKDGNAVDVTVKVLKGQAEQFSGVVNGFAGYEPDCTGAFGTGKQVFETPDPIHVGEGETVDFTVTGNQDYSTGHYETVGLKALVFPIPAGALSGTVTSSAPGNAPVAGATIKTDDGTASVTTDSNGHYSVVLLPGAYTLLVSAPEFFKKTEQVTMVADTPVGKDISLDPWPTTRWDAAVDFSTTSNPSGPWDYGMIWLGQLYPFSDSFLSVDGKQRGWTYTQFLNSDANGKVVKNISGARILDDQWHGYVVTEPNQLCADPGCAGELPTTRVRWTAPQATDVKLYCRFTGQKDILRDGQHAVDAVVKVLKNGTELFSGPIDGFAGYEPDHTGAFGTGEQVFETPDAIHVAQGDTIDFFTTGNQDYSTGHYEHVGLDALIFPMGAPPVDVDSLVGLKALGAGTNVNMTTPQVVTAATSTFSDGSCFIEEVQRTAGIRVVPAPGINLQLGHRIRFTGTVQVAGGEKYITINSLTSDTGGMEMDPLGLTVKSLVAYSGPNTVNLLVRVWGTVSSVSGGYATIDDGSNLGVRVKLDGLVSPLIKTISSGQMIGVSGPASNASGILTIRPRSDDDIVIFGP